MLKREPFEFDLDKAIDAAMNYKSPIELFQKEMEMQMEGDILKAVQKYAINVDKEELLKALQYDRGQYKEGFTGGYLAGLNHNNWIPCSDRLPEENTICLITNAYDGKVHEALYSSEEWYEVGEELGTYKAIAWMPFPKPYVPEEEE